MGKVDCTNSIPTMQQKCLKLLSLTGRNIAKSNSSSIRNPHAHLKFVHNKYARLQTDPLKTVGGVDPVKCAERTDKRTDKRTDGHTDRGQIIMPPHYRHGGIK